MHREMQFRVGLAVREVSIGRYAVRVLWMYLVPWTESLVEQDRGVHLVNNLGIVRMNPLASLPSLAMQGSHTPTAAGARSRRRAPLRTL